MCESLSIFGRSRVLTTAGMAPHRTRASAFVVVAGSAKGVLSWLSDANFQIRRAPRPGLLRTFLFVSASLTWWSSSPSPLSTVLPGKQELSLCPLTVAPSRDAFEIVTLTTIAGSRPRQWRNSLISLSGQYKVIPVQIGELIVGPSRQPEEDASGIELAFQLTLV